MDKHQPFYGTPLIRSLKNEGTDCEAGSSFKSRKARLDHQQTVRDSEGRQRFHGAFTGGFSAGYFNTVDTKEGFIPKEFVSHRSDRHGAANRRIDHQRAEDFMDEDDLGEFGIAPRKLRVNNIYHSHTHATSSGDKLIQALQARATESIGDRILEALSSSSSRRRGTQLKTSELNLSPPPTKNNYHGIGYEPLKKSGQISSQTASNPLVAILGQGKRLKISGEAFGSGVLEDDEDDYNNGSVNEIYGHDDIKNYDFNQSTSFGRPRAAKKSSLLDPDDRDTNILPGFTLAKDLSAMSLSDAIARYPRPNVPENWTMPTRSEPYHPPTKENPNHELYLQRLKTGVPLGHKFTTAIKPFKTTDMESKAGLLYYSDIRTSTNVTPGEERDDTSVSQPPTISRLVLEWRPCSLLCKRFNLPNPFPDNQFVGVRASNTNKDVELGNIGAKIDDESELSHVASLELRRSIFNVIFSDTSEVIGGGDDDPPQSCESSDSENAPQIVVLTGSEAEEDGPQSSPDVTGADDVIVIPLAHKEPEIITLSSSSSPSSVAGVSDTSSRQNLVHLVEEDEDAYGPPLPPSFITSINPNQGTTPQKSHKKSKKKKKKKHHRRSR